MRTIDTKKTASSSSAAATTASVGIQHTNIGTSSGGDRPQSTFIALDVSYRLIEALAEIVPAIERNDRDLGNQIRRAATSVSLNLAEGQRSSKGNQHKHYALAHGSASEVKAGLQVARAWGWITHSDRALAIIDRLLGLLWGLTHRCG